MTDERSMEQYMKNVEDVYYSNCIIVAFKEKFKDPVNVKLGCDWSIWRKPFFGIHCWWEKNGKEYHFQKDASVKIGWINYFWHKGSVK